MDPTTLQTVQVVFQACSSLAIAGGLVYTAVQFRAAKHAQHVANFIRMVEMQMGLRRLRVDEPSLASIYKHDVIGLDTDREVREHFLNLMQLSVFEAVWFAHQQGQLPDDYFESWMKRMADIATEESFQKMIDSPTMKILHEPFERYVKGIVAEARKGRIVPGGGGAGAMGVNGPTATNIGGRGR